MLRYNLDECVKEPLKRHREIEVEFRKLMQKLYPGYKPRELSNAQQPGMAFD
jgi:hypothetical protein